MLILTLITLPLECTHAIAFHTHRHFKSYFGKQDEPFVLPERNLTWKELLTYSTTFHLKIRLQATRSEKTGQLYFLDWTLPLVLTKRLHISNELCFRCL